MNRNIHNMAVFIEFIAGSALAILFHLVLHNRDAAFMIFGIGILLSLATYLIREDIEQAREILMEKYHQAHDITFTVARITDSECFAKANEIMAGLKRTLTLLQQGYIPLDETEFYMKSTRYMDESIDQVRAVDPVNAGWESRGAIVNYYQANIRALGRGVRITRVFVINQGEINDAAVQKALFSQHRDGIDVRVAFREELPAASDVSGRDTTSSYDFAIYDNRVVTEVFGQSGKYYGRKTRELPLIRNYDALFDLISHSSHTVTVENDRIVFAVDPAGGKAGHLNP